MKTEQLNEILDKNLTMRSAIQMAPNVCIYIDGVVAVADVGRFMLVTSCNLQLPAVYIGDNFEMFRPIAYFEKRCQHLKTVIAITVNCHQDIVSTRII